MPLRLVIVTPFLEARGGMERVVLKLAQHFDAHVHTLYYDPEHTFPEFKSLSVEAPAHKNFSLRQLPIGRRLATGIEAGNHFYNLKLSDYDLVNTHTTPSEWVRHHNSPVIWYCHSPNRDSFDLYSWRMKDKRLLSKAAYWASIQAFKFFEFETVPKIEWIFANSQNTQTRIKRYLNRDAEVLHPGVDLHKFSTRGYEKFFFFPSRIVPEKQHVFAIEAFRMFASRTKGWKLIIAGSVPHTQEVHYKKLLSLGGGSVAFERDLDDKRLADLYSRCYCVLYPPVNEDFGLVPLEAFASRKPCIAMNEGGPRETITDGVDGFLVGTPQEMAARMEWLSRNPEKCALMGRNGRKKAEKKFTWERFLKRFEEKAKETVEQHNAK